MDEIETMLGLPKKQNHAVEKLCNEAKQAVKGR